MFTSSSSSTVTTKELLIFQKTLKTTSVLDIKMSITNILDRNKKIEQWLYIFSLTEEW